jgi:acetylornithine deacetylase
MEMLTRLLADLVAINSVNPDLVPGGAGEGEAARFVASWLEAAGLEVHIDEVRPGRPNVIGVARGSGGGKTLLLNGHLDTVGVAGMADPHLPRVADGRMYGRGTYDMKGGLAACLVAAAEACGRGLRGDVIITAVIDEEYAGLGTLDVAARYRADAAIVAEPTELRLMVAHKGFVWLDVEIAGAAAHGSIAGAVDAIARMGGVLVGIDQLSRQLLAGPAHPLLGTGSIHASLISGGQEQSSYPERCALAIERRTVPGETPAQVEAELRAIIDRLVAETPDLRATLRLGVHRAPMETPVDAELPALIRSYGAAVTGRAIPVAGVAYWTDAASLAEAGIPAVLFGPGGAGAHATEEWVDLESVAHCAAIYGQVIDAFCG